MKRRYAVGGSSRLPLFFACLLLPLSAGAASIDALIERAGALELARDPAWLRLLHYEDGRSLVVSDWFFLAPQGRRDPAAELEATLRALAVTAPRAPRDESPRCQFPARVEYLARRLNFDPDAIAPQGCDRFRTWYEALAVTRLTLVFPAAYINSPSSMFGHTLLKLDSPRSEQGSDLLAYAVNFAATTQETNGLVFAAKGLTGQYPGRFSLLPYYEKVKEYARIDNRDIWEYPLNFDAAAIDRLLRHLWELRGAEFRYYFFDDNCSYQLLALLETARPDLDLTGDFGLWAIPSDTVRVLTEQPQLTRPPAYRPALRTQIEHAIGLLPTADRIDLAAVVGGRARPADLGLPPQRHARVLKTAHDLLYYRYQGERMAREEALPRARASLIALSQLPATPGLPPPPTPAVPPDRGHPTARLQLGLARPDAGPGRLILGARPAYHDLLDPAGGYVDGAQIDFLQGQVSVADGGEQARLEALNLIDIVSITPRSAFFKPISWRVATGLRRPSPHADAPLRAYLDGGPGVAYGDWRHLVGYGFALARLATHRSLPAGHEWRAGLQVGALATLGRHLTLQLEYDHLADISHDTPAERRGRVQAQWHINRSLGLRMGWQRSWSAPVDEAVTLTLQHYL